jgi:hypothetical protein
MVERVEGICDVADWRGGDYIVPCIGGKGKTSCISVGTRQ